MFSFEEFVTLRKTLMKEARARLRDRTCSCEDCNEERKAARSVLKDPNFSVSQILVHLTEGMRDDDSSSDQDSDRPQA